MEPPAITDWTPGSAQCHRNLTIRGQRFGSSRKDVDGRVLIHGIQASIISWEMTQIEIEVPVTPFQGNDRELTVIVAGKAARATGLRVSC